MTVVKTIKYTIILTLGSKTVNTELQRHLIGYQYF